MGSLLLFQVVRADLTGTRTWSDQTGRQIEARLLTYDTTLHTGTFRRDDGYLVHIPLNMLATADQTFVTELLAKEDQESVTEDESETEAEANQSENYRFSSLTKNKTDGYIATKEGWEYKIQALRAKVRYRGESPPSGQQFVKAYFYDRNKQLIQSYDGPGRIQREDGGYTDPPKTFKENATEEVYFPLSAYLDERDWQRCVIVFGDKQEAYARIYPSGDLSEYSFPERTLIFGERLKKASNAQKERKETEYHITSARKSRFNATAWVDGAWVDGVKGILVEVEVGNSLPTSNYFLRVHFFDNDQKRLLTVKKPTQIESDDAANTYTTLPKFAKTDDKMIAFFPLDSAVEAVEWRKAVVVFGDKDRVDVAIVGGNISDLELLEFPEKHIIPN